MSRPSNIRIDPAELNFPAIGIPYVPAALFGDGLDALHAALRATRSPKSRGLHSGMSVQLEGRVYPPWKGTLHADKGRGAIIGVGQSTALQFALGKNAAGIQWQYVAPNGGLRQMYIYTDVAGPNSATLYVAGSGYLEGFEIANIWAKGAGERALIQTGGTSAHKFSVGASHFRCVPGGPGYHTAYGIDAAATNTTMSVADTTFVGFRAAARLAGYGQTTIANCHVENPGDAGFIVSKGRRGTVAIRDSDVNHNHAGPWVESVPHLLIDPDSKSSVHLERALQTYGADAIDDFRQAGRIPDPGSDARLDAEGRLRWRQTGSATCVIDRYESRPDGYLLKVNEPGKVFQNQP